MGLQFQTFNPVASLKSLYTKLGGSAASVEDVVNISGMIDKLGDVIGGGSGGAGIYFCKIEPDLENSDDYNHVYKFSDGYSVDSLIEEYEKGSLVFLVESYPSGDATCYNYSQLFKVEKTLYEGNYVYLFYFNNFMVTNNTHFYNLPAEIGGNGGGSVADSK